MAQGPETVAVTNELAAGAAPGPVVGRLALVAPKAAGDTVGDNVISEYTGVGVAIDERQSGSALATAVEHALREGHSFVFAVNPAETAVNYTFGDSGALQDGQVPANSLPLTSITSVSKDSVVIADADIVYLGDDQNPATYVFSGTEKMAINMKTGVIRLATATSGVGAGLVLAAKMHDWDSAFEILGEVDYEYIVPAGFTYEPKYWGVWSKFIAHADTDNKMVAGMLPSAAVAADYDGFVTATRNGRLSLLAAKGYTGDGTTAYAAYRAKYRTRAQIKQQPAPKSITISAGYLRSEYGGHQSPASGTWHYMGVNAVYKYGGAYFISASRSSTGITAKDRFDYVQRVIRDVHLTCKNVISNQITTDPQDNPVDSNGIEKTRGNLDLALRAFRSRGDLVAYAVNPPLSLTQSQVDNGEMGEFEISIQVTRQIGFVPIRLRSS